MTQPQPDIQEIFCTALEKRSPEELREYIEAACRGDVQVRTEIERLLESHNAMGNFLAGANHSAGETELEEITAFPQDKEAVDQIRKLLEPSTRADSLGRLGHYEVLECLGQGAYGIVLRALDDSLQRMVAVKVLSPEMAATSPPRKRFLREARTAAKVRHENVVHIYAVEEQPTPYLVMEYIPGETLQERLDRIGPLEVPEVLRLGCEMARGLAAAHEQGLIHRDIKPANILLEKGLVERVKISDFGLARAADDASLTQSGIIAGTPMFMAPEQARGETIDQRADLFSLGSVLYTMVSGRPPFRASNTVAVLKRVCDDTPRPIQELIPETPQWLCDIIARLHAKSAEDRYQTAGEVADLLSEHLAYWKESPPVGSSSATTAPSKATPRENRSPSRARGLIAAAAVLCLLGGLSLTEVTGVTRLVPSVIRILTPDGTLVVQTDDPGVKVTIEGDGGLVISGAGPQEVRLRPGSYKIQANRDGIRVPLEKELVSIVNGGREVVRVKLEAPQGSPAGNTPTRAFVLLGEHVAERKFDTLSEAVSNASDGDTIEIRGNGPFDTRPFSFARRSLTIRAGEGYSPVIQFISTKGGSSLLEEGESITLEGLSFVEAPHESGQIVWTGGVVIAVSASLHVANCRFQTPSSYCIWSLKGARRCVLKNCEFYSTAVAGALVTGSGWTFDNCVHLGPMFAFNPDSDQTDAFIRISRATCVGGDYATLVSTNGDDVETLVPPLLRMRVSSSVLDAGVILQVNQNHKRLPDAEHDEFTRRLYAWHGERNLYAVRGAGTGDASFRAGAFYPDEILWKPGPKDLAGWKAFWNSAEAGSAEGRPAYQGGDLLSHQYDAPGKLTPEDFRLQPGSPGHKAGDGGQDLGADIDLVGTGATYERWKKTPGYQKWLQETGQVK